MDKTIKDKIQNELLVTISHDLWCKIEPEADFFWFPKMSAPELENWWINQDTMVDYSDDPYSLPGEVILADSEELKSLCDEIALESHHVFLVTDGDQGSHLISPTRGTLFHQGYVGPIYGTKYWSWDLN
ncbi:hypothetical protein [Vibrio rotiferianus]|uniref:hypothetical protein n=1 Tax=Vibrio rotiferianus TaxID=190895 RepID=UPI0003A6433E|nr:hypothetical protein [Vibrio rotiferianus]PIB14077.1 hypothetical protein B853_16102 [Vibrio rotiferianus CAIM 577 = LMG 21460]